MKHYITKQKQSIIKMVLGVEDYNTIADKTGFSFSTVSNILNRQTRVSDRTYIVEEALCELALEKIEELNSLKSKLHA